MESSSKSVALPKFDGTVKTFQGWLVRFQAYATVYKFLSALKKDSNMPDSEGSEIDESTAAGKRRAKAKAANALAVASLALSFSKDTLLMYVTKSMTAEWSSGLAYKIMDALKKKYQPDDQLSRVEVRVAMNKVQMKAKEDPTVLIDQLKMIEAAYIESSVIKMDEADMIAILMERFQRCISR